MPSYQFQSECLSTFSSPLSSDDKAHHHSTVAQPLRVRGPRQLSMEATVPSFEVGLPAWTGSLDALGSIAEIVVTIEVRTGAHLPKTPRTTRSPPAPGTSSALLGTSAAPGANSCPPLLGALTPTEIKELSSGKYLSVVMACASSFPCSKRIALLFFNCARRSMTSHFLQAEPPQVLKRPLEPFRLKLVDRRIHLTTPTSCANKQPGRGHRDRSFIAPAERAGEGFRSGT